eukprot:m.484504 g.484504  ORF g.484504 m.484504 type:complete len:297 (-) comp23385_c0_seq1:58-948(-)
MVDRRVEVRVVGLASSGAISRAIFCAEAVTRGAAEGYKHAVEELTEVEWAARRAAEQAERPGHECAFTEACLCFVGSDLLPSVDAFVAWAEGSIGVPVAVPDGAIVTPVVADSDPAASNPRVYLDLELQPPADGADASPTPLGRLVFVLCADKVPRTAENFRALCTGERGSTEQGVRLSYEGSVFHRIQPGGWAQGGDIVSGSGQDGTSIYGDTFADENFSVPHNARGILAMANKGLHTNASQFLISFKPSPWMEGKYVAFGQLVEGSETLAKLEALETYNQRPVPECRIAACGQL